MLKPSSWFYETLKDFEDLFHVPKSFKNDITRNWEDFTFVKRNHYIYPLTNGYLLAIDFKSEKVVHNGLYFYHTEEEVNKHLEEFQNNFERDLDEARNSNTAKESS